MSIPITLTSNKCEFNNYFSDNIVVKKNSEVALTKAVLSIPVLVNQFVTMPLIIVGATPVQPNNPCLEIIVDGIKHRINWTEIYNSYTTLDLADGFEPQTLANFYNGTFRLPLNNFVTYQEDAAGGAVVKKRRANINEILAHAINAKYLCYEMKASPIYTNSGYNNTVFALPPPIIINGSTYEPEAVYPHSMDMGFTAIYTPNRLTSTNSVGVQTTSAPTWNNYRRTTITNNATPDLGLTITSDATGAAAPPAGEYDRIATYPSPIDPNGGILQFTLEDIPASTSMIFGFRYGGDEFSVLNPSITTMKANDILFGIVINRDAGVNVTCSIIDGRNPVTADTVNVYPLHQNNIFGLGERVSIGMKRVNINQGDYKYAFSIYRNPVADDFFDNDTELVYTSDNYISAPLALAQIFMANNTGVIIEKLRTVPLTDDSREQISRTFNDQAAGASYVNNMSINPIYDYTTEEADTTTFSFFQTLGINLHFDRSNAGGWPGGDNANGFADEITPFVYKKIFKRPIVSKDVGGRSQLAVIVGENEINKSVEVELLPDGTQRINYLGINSVVPRMLDVKIKDLNINDYNGQFVGAGSIFSTTSVTRDVCHIPVPGEYLDKATSFDMDVSYEPYNLIYRTLQNEHQFPINNFNIQINYKDFITNQEVSIDEINGTLKLELHIKQERL